MNANEFQKQIQKAFQHHSQGELNQAQALYEDILKHVPEETNSLYHLGFLHYQRGELEKAQSYLEKTIALEPQHADALLALGNILDQTGHPAQALAIYEKLLPKRPQDSQLLNDMGLALKKTNRIKEALQFFDRSLVVAPQDPETLNNKATALMEINRLDEATALYQKVLALRPTFHQAHVNLGITYLKYGDYQSGRKAFKQALDLKPDYALARWFYRLSLPMLYDSTQEIEKARQNFIHELDLLIQETPLATPQEKRDALSGAGQFSNFYLQYQAQDDLELQKKFGQFLHNILKANYPQWTEPHALPQLTSQKKIKVGYISAYLKNHTVCKLFRAWLEELNKDQFEVYAYSLEGPADSFTESIRQNVAVFRELVGSAETLMQDIINDDLHVLVYLDIGMKPITNLFAALRLAPVQCVAWGHPITSGLPTIDYFLTSALMETEDSDSYYSEKLIRLKNLSVSYAKPQLPESRKTRADFGLPSSDFLYLSSQSLFKYLPQDDDVFPRIAKEVPNAHFVFLAGSGSFLTQKFATRLAKRFQEHNLDFAKHVTILPQQSYEDFLQLNLLADLLLDTFSWSGGNTTLEATGCGLPVITCPSQFMRSRHSFAVLKRLGLDELITANKDDYVTLAVRFAQDSHWRHHIRDTVHANASRIFQDQDAIHDLENFYKQATGFHNL